MIKCVKSCWYIEKNNNSAYTVCKNIFVNFIKISFSTCIGNIDTLTRVKYITANQMLDNLLLGNSTSILEKTGNWESGL